MIIAYILNKNNYLGVKIIGNRNKGVFKYNGEEYLVDRSCLMQKKFLGFKTFFFLLYVEGNKNPLEIDVKDGIVSTKQVSLNALAYILNKIRTTKQERIMMFLIAGNLILSLVILLVINNSG